MKIPIAAFSILAVVLVGCGSGGKAVFGDIRLPMANSAQTYRSFSGPNAILTINRHDHIRLQTFDGDRLLSGECVDPDFSIAAGALKASPARDVHPQAHIHLDQRATCKAVKRACAMLESGGISDCRFIAYLTDEESAEGDEVKQHAISIHLR